LTLTFGEVFNLKLLVIRLVFLQFWSRDVSAKKHCASTVSDIKRTES